MSAGANDPLLDDVHEDLQNAAPLSTAKWMFGRTEIDLVSDPAVFRPTLTTSLLIESVLGAGVRGKTVLDLGCGSGPISVALALSGAQHVYAADLMPRACEIAAKNTIINRVADRVTVVQGNLFEPVSNRKFDLIVDDVSGVAEEVARLSSWFPPEVPLGGADGTILTVEVLKNAERHLNPGGHLYFPVLSLSNAGKIVSVARGIFDDRLTRIASKQVPFNHELKEHLDALYRLRELGLIDFAQVRSRLCWSLEIFRADALE